MTCTWNEVVFSGEGEEARIKAHQIAFVFGNDRGEIVVPQLARDASHRFECVDMTAYESFQCLAVCELQIELSTVAFDQGEGIKLARSAVVD